MIDDNTVEY